jgi:rfaE bifunctional protein nucleotidyltransferase chain/domain
MKIAERIKEWSEINHIVSALKEQGKTIVFTNGCFDILHYGHLKYLEEAKACGDILVVGLNSDQSVKRLKGPSRPVNGQFERAYLLCGLKPVDYVVIFDQDTPLDLIKLIIPNVLVKGGDWKANQIVGSDLVIENGGQVKSLLFQDGFSTTNIIEKINKDDKNGSR